MSILVIGRALAPGILTVIGSMIGPLIGLVILGPALGHIDPCLAEAVWEMGADEMMVSRLFRGVPHSIALPIADLPMLAINHPFPHWLMMVIMFIIHVPKHGFVGAKVAEVFETSVNYQEDGTFGEDRAHIPC